VKPIDLRPRDLDCVLRILAAHVPDREVWAFGSRVSGTAKDFSDLDLVILDDEPISTVVLANLHEAFRESDLPFKVDVIDWAVTQEHFRRIIEREYIVLSGGQINAPLARLRERGRG
jgi:predicted nucleotidyltransferase